MPIFKVIYEIDAKNEFQALALTHADTYVHSKIIKRKGKSTKPKKCWIYMDGMEADGFYDQYISRAHARRVIQSRKSMDKAAGLKRKYTIHEVSDESV